jgi:predicted membrane channel-forming protein YqfA (hemolysin III family)
MTIVALLPVMVFVAGLLMYLFCVSVSKTSIAEVGRMMFFAGLLAFLMSSGAQSCTMGTAGGGSAQHR